MVAQGILSDARLYNKREEFLKSFPSIGLSFGLLYALRKRADTGLERNRHCGKAKADGALVTPVCSGNTMEDTVRPPSHLSRTCFVLSAFFIFCRVKFILDNFK